MPADPGGGAGPPVPLPIEDVLDLHPFQPRDIPPVVEEYLREAAARGFREVRLIHGRGIGFQRQVVQDLLARHPQVLRFADAPPERGGWGATVVWLKPPGADSPTRRAERDRQAPPGKALKDLAVEGKVRETLAKMRPLRGHHEAASLRVRRRTKKGIG